MRPGLEQSIAVHGEGDGYPKGSIVLCQACWKPLYRLERGIGVGERAGRSVTAYRPMSLEDLAALAERARRDKGVPPGLAGLWRSWTAEERHALASRIPELRTGAPAMCPFCGKSWLYARAVTASETIDHAYTIEPLVLRPEQPIPEPALRAWMSP